MEIRQRRETSGPLPNSLPSLTAIPELINDLKAKGYMDAKGKPAGKRK
jgi:hypothetical protein